jgi:hypothetical protein
VSGGEVPESIDLPTFAPPMIEQTELIINEWNYTPPPGVPVTQEKLISEVELDVMKKRASTKKGIACRFSCRFLYGDQPVLVYVAEDSYVIDLEDVIDKNEILRMIRNTYSKFTEKFDFRKLGTLFNDRTLPPLDESKINVEALIPLLQ